MCTLKQKQKPRHFVSVVAEQYCGNPIRVEKKCTVAECKLDLRILDWLDFGWNASQSQGYSPALSYQPALRPPISYHELFIIPTH